MEKAGVDENIRVSGLLNAQVKAARLFDEVESRELVRAGANTLDTARDNPPDRVIAGDDSSIRTSRARICSTTSSPCEGHGWEFGGVIADHLVGEFPHEKIAGDEIDSYIAPGSNRPMRRKDRSGRECHWILEVHLVDRDRRYGGFHEELLDIV
ncbi:hypothetical protein [Mycolicibacterium sp. 624]|uniref:hypothetical protein n=1 Tax=Mycolicibacterium sp. 624 TaxID=3156314 RepID=UPI0033921867